MKTKLIIITLLACMGAALRAEDKKDGAKKDAYPINTCVVSGDELGSMGDSIRYQYKTADGKTREILFCCKDCIKNFKKDPEKYLKILDEAAAKKAAKPESK